MSGTIKNYGLAMVSTLAITSVMLAAVVRADPNPYVQDEMRIAEGDASTNVKKTTTTVKDKKKIQSVEGVQQVKPTGIDRSSKPMFPREAPPAFVKSGKPAEIDRKIQTQSGVKSLPSAVDVQRKIKSSTDN
jgi:hypothetical protein